jgi:archaellum component FlaC|nr:MAG TPA: hypothetical protein [Caudoviricetes sp.]
MKEELEKIEQGITELMAAVECKRNELNKIASKRRQKMSRNEKELSEKLFACKTYLRFACTGIRQALVVSQEKA